MKSTNVSFDFNEFKEFYNQYIENLDTTDHFDSGFSVASHIFYNWVASKYAKQNNEGFKKICHCCGSEMIYTEDYKSTYPHKDKPVYIDRIKAHICSECGEVIYDSEEAKRIETIVDFEPALNF